MAPRRTRRSLLAGLAVSPGLVGCLEGEDDEGDEPDELDGEGNGTDEEGNGGDTDDGTSDTADDTENDRDDGDATEDGYDLSVSHDLESWDGYDPDWSAPAEPPGALRYEVVIEHLEIPWDLAFGSNGDLFVSERTGMILRYDSESIEALASADVLDRADAVAPGAEESGWWAAGSEGGLLGIAVHPRYPGVPVVYACYTYEDGGEYSNRLVSYDVRSDDHDEPGATETTLIDAIPGHEIAHNGARLAFGPANYLWMTTGDALQNGRDEGEPNEALSPDPDSLAGKLLRIEPDGEPAPDNPFGDESEGDPRVYATGFRNPQGIAFLPDGRPVVTDHGGAARDEAMVVEAGEDHGWPAAEDGESYPGTDYARPVVNTGDETWAPSGCAFASGGGALQDRLLVGTLSGQHVNAITLHRSGDGGVDGGRLYDADWLDGEFDVTSHRLLPDELGRVRHVEESPDGDLYAITSNRDGRAGEGFPRERDDVLVRLQPAR